MRIAVTGSSGFIGRHLVSRLESEGNDVLGIDIVPPPPGYSPRAFEQCDILDAEALRECLAKFSAESVVHLAARTDLDETAGLEGYAVNSRGTRNVVDVVRELPSVKRAIYTSTQLVHPPGYIPRSDTDTAPTTLYGRSKVAGESAVRESDGGGVTWCITRPTTVWGPGMYPHYVRFLQLVRAGRYFHFGKEPIHKSYAYVGNVAYQYSRLLGVPAESIHGRTFYLADYEPIDLRAWAEGLQQTMGAGPIRTIPIPVAKAFAIAGDVASRLGYARAPLTSFRLRNMLTPYIANIEATRSVCGPLPFTEQQGIEETVGWFVRHA